MVLIVCLISAERKIPTGLPLMEARILQTAGWTPSLSNCVGTYATACVYNSSIRREAWQRRPSLLELKCSWTCLVGASFFVPVCTLIKTVLIECESNGLIPAHIRLLPNTVSSPRPNQLMCE